MGLAKQAIDDGLDGSLARGLDVEAEAFVEVFGTEDARVGVASFLEHGPGKATLPGPLTPRPPVLASRADRRGCLPTPRALARARPWRGGGRGWRARGG